MYKAKQLYSAPPQTKKNNILSEQEMKEKGANAHVPSLCFGS